MLELLFITDQPFDRSINTGLHIFLFFVSELNYTLRAISKTLLNVQFNFFEYFALNVFLNLFLCILPFFKPLIKNFIIASHHYNEIEPFRGKHRGTMKINNQTSILNIVIFFNELNEHIFVEYWYVQLIIPLLVEFVLFYSLANRQILKIEGLIEKLAKSRFTRTRCSSHQNVWSFMCDVTFLFLHVMLNFYNNQDFLFIFKK